MNINDTAGEGVSDAIESARQCLPVMLSTSSTLTCERFTYDMPIQAPFLVLTWVRRIRVFPSWWAPVLVYFPEKC